MNSSSEEAPIVFVYGALRSGTTVFRLMLKAHEGISCPGEVDFLFDYLARDASHPTGWRYDKASLSTDRVFRAKQITLSPVLDGLDQLTDMLEQLKARSPGLMVLTVHRHATHIFETLPDALFIHLLRDPRDVARSSIGMGWAGTLYYGVDHWINTETEWDEIFGRVSHRQVIELKYEDLFTDLDYNLRRVCEFLGVPFSAAMLKYHETSTYGPPDPSLIEQWRRCSEPREIALMEGKADLLMQARGYALAGKQRSAGPIERLGLFLVDRARVWRFGIRRFGVKIYLSEKFSRWLGLTRFHNHVGNQIQEATTRRLK